MKNGLFKKWLPAALCVLALGSTAALAEPDSFYLGNGHNGSRTVSTSGTVINSYAQVTAPLAPGDIQITVGACTGDAACFAVGDLVMVLQSTGIVPEPGSGTTGALDISGSAVGRWELARLTSASATTLGLSAPLVRSYAANVTQVIRVPEYVDFTVDFTGSVAAQPWNRSSGGVIALLVQGTLTNQGEINASSAGFLGGTFVAEGSVKNGCTGVDEASPSGALKGESIASTRYGSGAAGRGNVANGGGGGVCFRAGGGGGSNGGAGGVGGNSFDGPTINGRAVGGMGGVVLNYSMLNQLTFGGGGGVGHGTAAAQAGGAGGGIIFIRANQLNSPGVITASGAFGGPSNSDAASGGGGGGSIYMRFAGTADCVDVDASGGTGGSTNASRVGPGGGGGGGRVLFQSAGGTCVADLNSVTGANPGTQKAGTVPAAYGAVQGNSGIVTTLTGAFVMPPVPTVTLPANNTSTSNRRPLIEGTAQADSTVVIYIDGIEVGRATSNSAGTFIFPLPANLSEGSHTVAAATELNGVQSARSTANTFTVDVTKPDTFIVSGPVASTNATSATFDFNSNETGVRYECSLDGGTYATCTDPVSFTGLTERSHNLLVRAVDAAGNVDDSPASYTWVVDVTPPNTIIVSGPPSRTNATSAAFDFNVEVAEPGVTYECSLDSGAFTSCTDPVTFTGLGQGNHTLDVRAKDTVGNVDASPATYAWTVDLTPPDTTIVSGPPSRTNATSAMFDFSSNEAGVSYECSLDSGAFTSCADPATFTGLTEKSYNLQVRAVDAAGNVDPTPESYTWTVDITPPDTTIVSGPPSRTSSTSATFDFSSEAGVSYVCRLEGAMAFTSCTDPETFMGLGNGDHRLEVSAVDVAGNMDPTPAVYTWTVDLTPPDTTIVSGPPALGNSPSATFDFSSPEAGATFECSLDSGAFTSCTDPVTFSGLGNGNHTLEVRAVDTVGNVDASPATYAWTVDLTLPETTIVSGPASTSSSPDATFDFSSSEAGVSYECSLDSGAFTACTDPVTFMGLADGSHTLQVRAVDAAGNVDPTPESYTWTVDAALPDTTIVSGPALRTNATDATFDFSSPEAGATFECSLDNAAFVSCTDPATFTGLAEGSHTLQVRARDAANNVDPSPASYTWTVDLTAPAAPGVASPEQNGTVDTLTPVITGSAEPNSTVTVIIDGQEVGTAQADASGNWSYTPTTPLTPGSHQVAVRATDEAGNAGPVSEPRTFTIVEDASAPETTITSGPSGTVSDRTATFELGSNEPGVTYECSLDGAAYTPCTSPVTFADLATGEHTLQVRARDAAGNVDATPATRTWTVSGDVAFLGDGVGCSATGGDASLLLMGLGTFLTLARRRRKS